MHTPTGHLPPNSINNIPLVDTKYLHPFGCLVWYKVPEPNRKKLDPKGRAALLLSYLAHGNGFRVWDLETHKVVKSRDVLFHDNIFPYKRTLTVQPFEPLKVEVDWPPPLSASINPRPRVGIFRSDRRLQASIHNPNN